MLFWLIIFWLFVTHFISDFLFKTRTKEENLKILIKHTYLTFLLTVTSTLCLILTIWIWLGLDFQDIKYQDTLLFPLVYSILHGLQDLGICKFYKLITRLSSLKEEILWWFFGADQLLHIFILMYLFNKMVVGLWKQN